MSFPLTQLSKTRFRTNCMTDRKFPIGQFVKQESYSAEELDSFIRIIETIPAQFRALVENLSDEDLGKSI